MPGLTTPLSPSAAEPPPRQARGVKMRRWRQQLAPGPDRNVCRRHLHPSNTDNPVTVSITGQVLHLDVPVLDSSVTPSDCPAARGLLPLSDRGTGAQHGGMRVQTGTWAWPGTVMPSQPWTGPALAFISALVSDAAYSLEHDRVASTPPLSPRRPLRSSRFFLPDRWWVAASGGESAGRLICVAASRPLSRYSHRSRASVFHGRTSRPNRRSLRAVPRRLP